MNANVLAKRTVKVGRPTVVECSAPCPPNEVVFEDDGETGYFYAVDFRCEKDPVQDALHIHNVAAVTDRSKPSVVEILWTPDGAHSALLINGYAHAVFDFAAKQGYCRSGFPPPKTGWSPEGHTWNDDAAEPFV